MPLCRITLPLALLLSASTAAAQPKDRLGDPLPAGAIARIGTTRFQLDRVIQAVAVAPDGKRIAAVSDSMLGVWDVPSGKQVLNLPWLRAEAAPAGIRFAADGKTLIAMAPSQSALCEFDAATGKLRRLLGKDVEGWEMSRDGRTVLAVRRTATDLQYTVERLHPTDQQMSQQWDYLLDPVYWQTGRSVLEYFYLSANGNVLAAHEIGMGARKQMVRVFGAATGAELQRWPLDWPPLRGAALSDDGKLLGAASDGAAHVWEIATGKELARWTLPGGVSTGLFALAFAANGASLFITDATGIGRWDWGNGKRLQDYPNAGGPIAFTDGGKTMAVQGPIGAIRLLDVATGKDLCPLPRAGNHVAIAPDSRHIAWSEGGAIVLADRIGSEIRRWPAHEHFVGPLAFAPDGRTLASAGTDLRIHLWDIPEGRERRTLIRTGVQQLFFSPDGRRLVTSGSKDACLWDVASGKRLGFWYGWGEAPVMAPGADVIALPDRSSRRLRIVEAIGGKELHTFVGYRPARAFALELPRGATIADEYAPLPPTFSPDGRLLLRGAAGNAELSLDAIHVSEVASGRRLPTVLDGATLMLNQVAFTPDSRLLAVMASNCRLQLLNARTGSQVRLLGVGAAPMTVAPVFTPDSRTLITAIGSRVHIWEVASGGEIVCRRGHQDAVRELTVSADGRLLASGSGDRTTLVWDLAHLAPGASAPIDALWDDLAIPDAARGRRAVEALVAAPANAVALLAKRLPVAAPDPQQLARWLAELNSDDFAERQAAERGLDRFGELAGPALRQALSAKPPIEARRRMENLLKKLDGPALSAAQLRAVRGVQVLEMLGSAEARRVLGALAKGPGDALLTSEARAALGRISKP